MGSQRGSYSGEGHYSFKELQKFAIEFLLQARAIRYVSWLQVRDEVLITFLYDEDLNPAGDSWYKQVVALPLRQVHFS